MFGETVPDAVCSEAKFEPIVLPNIKTLTVDICDTYHCYYNNFGKQKDFCSPPDQINCRSAWEPTTEALQRLVKRNGSLPPSARLFVSDVLFKEDEQIRTYVTLLRTEMTSQTTLAFPANFFDASSPLCLLRTIEGRQIIITNVHDINFFVNDLAAQYAWGGEMVSHVPAAPWPMFMPDLGPKERLAWDPAVEERPDEGECDIQLWKDEKLAGEKLLLAEVRKGPENYLSRKFVVEKTPPGFYRTGSNRLVRSK